MTQAKILDQNAVKAAVAKLANEHEKLRKTLKDSMTGVNALIEQKSAELNKLIMSVSIDDATALLMNQLRDDIKFNQASAYATDKILSARKATNFGAVETAGGFDGGGNLTFSQTIGKPIHLVEYDGGIFNLLALAGPALLPAIEQTVRETLKAAGCAESGPSTDELLNQARALSAEIQALEAQRRDLRDQFAMTAVEDQPSGYQDFLNRTGGGVIQSRTEPSVKRVDGFQLEYGHSRLEAMQLAEDQVDKINREVAAENERLRRAGRV